MSMNVNIIAIILIVITLALFARVWVPWGVSASGNLVSRETLSVLGRLRMHGPAASLLYLVAITLLVVRVRHPPVLDLDLPLDGKRKAIGWITAALFALCVHPVPFEVR